MDTTSRVDVYLKVWFRKQMVHQTAVLKDDHYPKFNEEFIIKGIGVNEAIKFMVKDQDRLKDDDLGQFSIVPSSVIASGNNGILKEYSFDADDKCHISVRITWTNSW